MRCGAATRSAPCALRACATVTRFSLTHSRSTTRRRLGSVCLSRRLADSFTHSSASLSGIRAASLQQPLPLPPPWTPNPARPPTACPARARSRADWDWAAAICPDGYRTPRRDTAWRASARSDSRGADTTAETAAGASARRARRTRWCCRTRHRRRSESATTASPTCDRWPSSGSRQSWETWPADS